MQSQGKRQDESQDSKEEMVSIDEGHEFHKKKEEVKIKETLQTKGSAAGNLFEEEKGKASSLTLNQYVDHDIQTKVNIDHLEVQKEEPQTSPFKDPEGFIEENLDCVGLIYSIKEINTKLNYLLSKDPQCPKFSPSPFTLLEGSYPKISEI